MNARANLLPIVEAVYSAEPEQEAWANGILAALWPCMPGLLEREPWPGSAYLRLETALVAVRNAAGVARRAEQRTLSRIAAHVEGGLKLRQVPEQVVAAVLTPDGGLQHLHDTAPVRGGVGLDAVAEWRALLSGRYSIVTRVMHDGTSCYLLIVNGPAAREQAALDRIEIDVLTLSARGSNGKDVALELGLSESRVSTGLSRAARKLGLGSRVALVHVASCLLGVRTQRVDPSLLTAAERHILELLRRGLSNAEIAAQRCASRNTVANQVSSILRKTGRSTRRVLVAHTVPRALQAAAPPLA